MTGQAFLLTVISNAAVPWGAAAPIAAAGIVASLAGGLTMINGVRIEGFLSAQVSDHATQLGMLDPDRKALPGGRKLGPLDSPSWNLWPVVLVLFIAADVAALIAPRV